jgi:uncharacterized protein (TIGR00251 family)
VTPDGLVQLLRSQGRLDLKLKVIPKSSRNEIVCVSDDGTVKLKVTAVPEKGKANAAVCEFLADLFGVAKRNVEIVRGETSSTKLVTIRL